MNSNRVEAFSDGVLAIVITIMILEIKVPTGGSSFEQLKPLYPKFISYILSFIYVGIYWNNHHHLFQATKFVDGRTLWANLFLLFALSLIPFTTGWMGENNFENAPVVLYGLNLLFCAIAYFLLEKSIVRMDHHNKSVVAALKNTTKEYVSTFLYFLGIGLSIVQPLLGLLCYMIVAVLWLVPDKRIEKELMK